MLHFIRDRAQGWIAWFIVGLISIPFALWGVNSYLTGPSDVVVAEVNGDAIKQTQLQQSLQQYRDRMRSMLGEQFDPSMFEGERAKREVLQGLIEQKLIQVANKALGQHISDAEVSQIIKTTPAFQRDGEFDADYYAMVLARAGFNPASYEAQLRADLLSQELTGNIQTSAFASAQEVDNAIRLEKQQREIAYGTVPAQDFAEQVSVSDEEVKNYYDSHRDNYMAPETVKLNYIRLSVDDIAAAIEVSEADLEQYYLDNEDKFVGPEQRRASHILIEGDDEAALAQIEALQQRLQQGEDFAALAQQNSADTGSAAQGGDLGFFQREVMDPAFEEAAFALKNVGDVSEPVQTEFGYHLIKLTGIQQPEVQSFEQVRDEVEAMYRRQQAENLFFDQAEQLANLSYENPDNLDVAAEALGLAIQTTASFTRSGTAEGLTSEQKVINMAFSEDVLQHDLNSPVIELSDSELVVVHKNSYTPATLLPFESVAPAITEQLRFEKASDMAREKGQALLTQLQQGAEPEQLMQHWQPAQFYQRDSDTISAQVLNRAYAMPKPAQTANYSGFTADNGNFVLIKLSAVEDGAATAIDSEQKAALRAQLSRMQAEAEVEAFIAQLRNDADIDINTEAMQ